MKKKLVEAKWHIMICIRYSLKMICIIQIGTKWAMRSAIIKRKSAIFLRGLVDFVIFVDNK